MEFGGLLVGFHSDGNVPLYCYLGLSFYFIKSRNKLQRQSKEIQNVRNIVKENEFKLIFSGN